MHAAGRGLGGAVLIDFDEIDPKEIPSSTQPKQPIAYLTSQYRPRRRHVHPRRGRGAAQDRVRRSHLLDPHTGGWRIHSKRRDPPRARSDGGHSWRGCDWFDPRGPVACDFAPVAVRAGSAIVAEDASTGHSWFHLVHRVSAGGLFPARRLEAKKIQHLHNHLGRNSASVAMLASLLSGISYSLTIHGPTEFEMADSLALDEKLARKIHRRDQQLLQEPVDALQPNEGLAANSRREMRALRGI